MEEGERSRHELLDQLAHRRRADDVSGGVGFDAAVAGRRLDSPDLAVGIVSKPAQLTAHQHVPTALSDLAGRGFPHHARSLARILEALDQRLDDRLTVPMRAA